MVTIACVNLVMIVMYFKFAGMMYKSHKHYIGVKHFGFMALYWSVSLLIGIIY